MSGFLYVLAPILLVAVTVIINRGINLKYPMGVVSCGLIALVLCLAVQLFDHYVLQVEQIAGPLDDIVNVAVYAVIIAVAVLADWLINRNKRNKKAL